MEAMIFQLLKQRLDITLGIIRLRSGRKTYFRLPISRLVSKSLKKPVKCFFKEEMLITVVENVNKYNFRNRDANLVNIFEISAFLWLLYFTGILKANHLNTDDLWRIGGSGVEIFCLKMFLVRFRVLIRCF